jgi:HK97 family phage prohead protease
MIHALILLFAAYLAAMTCLVVLLVAAEARRYGALTRRRSSATRVLVRGSRSTFAWRRHRTGRDTFAIIGGGARVASLVIAGPTFDEKPTVVLDASTSARVFEVDTSGRTIGGLLVPWDVVATSWGQKYRFPKDSIEIPADFSRVKLWIQHDANRAVGFATSLESKDDGLWGAFKIARGAAGDEALAMAEDKVWDGFSVGIADGGQWSDAEDDVLDAVSVPLMETSLTPAPAFDDARVHSVAATAARTGRNIMECTHCGLTHTGACDPAAVAAFAARSTSTPPASTPAPSSSSATPAEPAQPATFTADQVAAAFASLGVDLANPQGASTAQPVSATAGLEVGENDSAIYRFDGLPNDHDFSTDLVAFGRDRSGEAGERLTRFMAARFAPGRNPIFDVAGADVAALNPARQRPDMFVDQRQFFTPVYDALYSGAITDNTPFIVPKFVSDADLVDDHAEGVEPDEGTYVATSQTVTPTPLSGKVPIVREVWDQGGNPQVSGLIWARMVYEYMQKLEGAAAGVLTAAAAGIADLALTAGAVDDDLVDELEAKLAALQFVAGGELLTVAMTHVDLYLALAAAKDSTGRKLLPIYGPQNASGGAQSRFKSLDVAGYEFAPAPALGATSANASNSWLLDPQAVHVWNSAPQRLEFQYRVAYVDLAIWGYKAAAVTDTAGVRQITYDPTA